MMLLADSGSTKTDWLLLHNGQQAARFSSAGFNPFYQERSAMAAGLAAEVLPRLPGPVDEIHFYGAGCADEASSRPVCDALAEAFPAARDIKVHSDLLAAARGLCGREAGIACILGTGSNNCLYDGKEITNNIGSLGFWLGDEGSGGYLGKRLVTKYLHNELPEDLQQAFQSTYPGVTRLSVLDRAYKQPFPNRYFAGYAPFLGKYLSEPFVQELVTEAFGAFLGTYVMKHPGARTLPVHFTGSVAHHFRPLLQGAVLARKLRMGTVARSPMPGLVRFHGTPEG